jgi:hypothetical protein
MAAPVLGGILVADKVVDLFVPALVFWVTLPRCQPIDGRANSSDEPRVSTSPKLTFGARIHLLRADQLRVRRGLGSCGQRDERPGYRIVPNQLPRTQ